MQTTLYGKALEAVFLDVVRCEASSLSPSAFSLSSFSLAFSLQGYLKGAYKRAGVPRAISFSLLAFGLCALLLSSDKRVYRRQFESFGVLLLLISTRQALKVINQLLKAGYLNKHRDGKRVYYQLSELAQIKFNTMLVQVQELEQRRASAFRKALEVLEQEKRQ